MTDIHPLADDEREPMSLTEVSRWASLTLIVVTTVAYGFIVLPQLSTTAPRDIDWQIPMLWAIGISIVGTIVLSIVIAIVNAIITRREPQKADVREKQIERYGDRIGQSIMAVGTAVVLVMAMLELDAFWIGNTLFALGAIGTSIGAIMSIRALRGVFGG